jgi:hypothetical protein
MNITRLVSIAAALGITASQWALCLAMFFYSQPVTALVPPIENDISSLAMPEIVVVGHRP